MRVKICVYIYNFMLEYFCKFSNQQITVFDLFLRLRIILFKRFKGFISIKVAYWKLLRIIVPNLININIFKGQECEETLRGEKRKNEVEIGNDNKKLIVMNKVIFVFIFAIPFNS